ncbi:TetR/AcrR family transcriptional regulator [Zhihengliuella alba]|uniref:TetR/AcrR family transcriptional regulator n=1 Tax=Zhihengliuella alba TaxID=547018 RepID=A0ABP7DR46_9MICC
MEQPGKPLTPRQAARQETEAAVLRIGNRLLDEQGADGLSLRAIARELGMVSSALYRYVANRDQLITLLITRAYNDLADAVDAALEHREDSIQALGTAMLAWSRSHPQRWALLYGTPLADYRAPAETTVAPGTRVMAQVARLAAALPEPGPDWLGAEAAADHPVTPLLQESLADLGLTASPRAALRALSIWVGLVGMVNALRFQQLGPGFDGAEEALLRTHLDYLTR